MKELNLHEEILKSLKLMTYDRSITIREQMSPDEPELYRPKQKIYKTFKSTDPLEPETTTQLYSDKQIKQKREQKKKEEKQKKEIQQKKESEKVNSQVERQGKISQYVKQSQNSDRLGRYGEFQPLKNVKKPFTTLEQKIYINLKKEIDGPGTDDKVVIYWLKKLDTLNYVKVLSLVIKNEGFSTITEWIMTDYDKPTERNYDEGEPSLWTPGGLGTSFNWWVNDKTVMTISSILSKFASMNEGEGDVDYIETGEVDLSSDSLGGTATNKELAEIAHVVLPIASVVATIFTGGWAGFFLGAFIELGDAAIYEFVDNNHYAAGLAALFAFAGPLDEILGPLVKRYGKRILVKLMKKKAMDKGEQATLRYVTRNQKKLARLTYLGMVRQVIKDYVMKAKDASKIVTFIFWLSKKGYIVSKFTSKFGLLIGGTFLTWDAIAYKLGLCNTSQLSPLKASENKVIQLIGTAGDYIQPYTKGCKTDKGKEIFKKMEKTLLTTNQRIITVLEDAIKTNFVFDKKYSKYNMYEVVLMQYVLKHFGFSYGKNKIINWGFYDGVTENMVLEFQKKYLGKNSADGIAGKNTLTKMISLVKGLGDTQIRDFNKLTWDEKEIKKLRSKAIEEIKKDMSEEEKKTSNVTASEIKKTIQEQKNEIVNGLENANNNLTYSEDDILIIKQETNKN